MDERRQTWSRSLPARLTVSQSFLSISSTIGPLVASLSPTGPTAEVHLGAAECIPVCTQRRTYFLSREVVGGQQSSNETDVDLKHGHLGILGKQNRAGGKKRSNRIKQLISFVYREF